jgi:iron complex outermembrane recepter protein
MFFSKAGTSQKNLIWVSIAWICTANFNIVLAQDSKSDKEPENISVTGSRISSIDIDNPQPVSIITREDIELSGDNTVADVLRNSSFNSFGSWKGQSGFGEGASVTAEVDLRGVGATLVLLDGRRLPGVGYNSGETQDLNAIPLSIVERIEILRSGASAIYGSDAIAGVINIITRNEFEGAKISTVYETRQLDEGELIKYEITTGTNNENSNLLVVFEHSEIDKLSDKSVSGVDNGLSVYSPASSVYYLNANQNYYSNWYSNQLCQNSNNTVELNDNCYYAFSNETWLFPKSEQDSILTKYYYMIDDALRFSMRGSFTRSKSHSRFAPTPIFTSINALENPELVPEEVMQNIDLDQDPYLYIYHRSDLLGNRDSEFVKNNIDILLSLDGDAAFAKGLHWNANIQRTVTDEKQYIYNLVNNRSFDIGIYNNQFDILNVAGLSYENWAQNATDFYGSVEHVGLYDVKQYRTLADASFSQELINTDWGNVSYLFGIEKEKLSFEQSSDPESAIGTIDSIELGDFIKANRERVSVFTEWAISVGTRFDASVALRYDNYEHSGASDSQNISRSFSELNPMTSVSYKLTDDFLFRGIYSKAFRAPSLKELFASRYVSSVIAYDYYYCDELDNPSNDSAYCDPVNQFVHNVTFGGNPELGAENGATFNIGFVWTPNDEFSAEINYYDITYKNKIVDVDIDQLLRIESNRPGEIDSVMRSDNQRIISINGGALNLDNEESNGIDILAEYRWATPVGFWNLDFNATHVLSYKRLLASSNTDLAGTLGRPALRANLSLHWSNDKSFFAWRALFIDSQRTTSDLYDDIGSLTYHNVQIGYAPSIDTKFSIGIKNVFDKSVPYYSGRAWRNFDSSLYDPSGRTWFIKLDKSF